MDVVDHDTLLAWLTRLQLTAIRDQLDSLLDEAAEKQLTLREALAFLVEREVSRKDERRIEMAFKIAHFPAVRELADFDFEAQPSVDERQNALRWAGAPRYRRSMFIRRTQTRRTGDGTPYFSHRLVHAERLGNTVRTC